MAPERKAFHRGSDPTERTNDWCKPGPRPAAWGLIPGGRLFRSGAVRITYIRFSTFFHKSFFGIFEKTFLTAATFFP